MTDRSDWQDNAPGEEPGAQADEQKAKEVAMPKDSIPDESAQEKGSFTPGPEKPSAPPGKIASVAELPAVRGYLNRIGEGQWKANLKSARIDVQRGNYPQTVARIKFSTEGVAITIPEPARSDHSPENFDPTEAEDAAIKAAMAEARFLEMVPASSLKALPPRVTEARAKGHGHYFKFYEPTAPAGADKRAGPRVLMIQIRIDGELPGDKHYENWTHWEDGKWRRVEPDVLPLYNAHRLKEASTVFIHEGAKAARYCQWMTDGKTREAVEARAAHPWGDQLANAVHVGWVGGALNPGRTDWSIIAKAGVKHAYIVPDNDEEGRSAVKAIARALQIRTEAVMFTPRNGGDGKDGWPKSFDLADAPATGPEQWPAFNDVIVPATWIARVFVSKDGKKTGEALTPAARGEWAYLRDIELIVHTNHRRLQYTPQGFDRAWGGWCDAGVKWPSKLVMDAENNALDTWTYRPGGPDVVALPGGGRALNRYLPGPIRPAKGDPGPWLEFLEYLVPDEDDRRNLKRWLATLIARPEVRMTWGVLAISETQGTGKSTLSDHILARLVGRPNVSWPRNEDVNSQFNSWAARRRLVIVREIYQSQSWKVYHALKDVTADETITINEKNRPEVTVENWCHVFASSNALNALKMDDKDRRWFIPEITEAPWHPEKFGEFHEWLKSSGLPIIAQWAADFGDYVAPGERAPDSLRKAGIIDDSRSEPAKAVLDWVRSNAQSPEDCAGGWQAPCVSFSQIKRMARDHGPIPDAELRRVLRLAELVPDPVLKRRTKLGKASDAKHTIWGTAQFWADLEKAGGDFKGFVDARLKEPERPERPM